MCQSLRRSLARSLARDASRRPYASRCPAVPLSRSPRWRFSTRRVVASERDRSTGRAARARGGCPRTRSRDGNPSRARAFDAERRCDARSRSGDSSPLTRCDAARRALRSPMRVARGRSRARSPLGASAARARIQRRDWRRIARDGRDDADAVGCERGFERLERARANDSARWTRSGIKKCSRRG